MDAGGGDGVHAGEFGFQGGVPLRGGQGVPAGAGRLVGRDLWNVQAGRHRPHVEAGAADDQRQPPTRGDVGGGPLAEGLKIGQRPFGVGVHDIHGMEAGLRPLQRRRLGRPDVHPPIHLQGVGGKNFGREPLRQDDAHSGLAGGRRADNGDTSPTLLPFPHGLV